MIYYSEACVCALDLVFAMIKIPALVFFAIWACSAQVLRITEGAAIARRFDRARGGIFRDRFKDCLQLPLKLRELGVCSSVLVASAGMADADGGEDNHHSNVDPHSSSFQTAWSASEVF